MLPPSGACSVFYCCRALCPFRDAKWCPDGLAMMIAEVRTTCKFFVQFLEAKNAKNNAGFHRSKTFRSAFEIRHLIVTLYFLPLRSARKICVIRTRQSSSQARPDTISHPGKGQAHDGCTERLHFFGFGIVDSKGVDCHGFDFLVLERAVRIISGCFSNFIYNIHTFCNFAKCSVCSV